jgi:hypothetical protein
MPEHGTPVLKHVGVLIIVVYSILLSAFIGGHIDCKNVDSSNNVKFAHLIANLDDWLTVHHSMTFLSPT